MTARVAAAASFLAAAHRSGHRGPAALARYARLVNSRRRIPGGFVSVAVLEAAIALEQIHDRKGKP